jgi:hypothetical protein
MYAELAHFASTRTLILHKWKMDNYYAYCIQSSENILMIPRIFLALRVLRSNHTSKCLLFEELWLLLLGSLLYILILLWYLLCGSSSQRNHIRSTFRSRIKELCNILSVLSLYFLFLGCGLGLLIAILKKIFSFSFSFLYFIIFINYNYNNITNFYVF